IGACLFIYFCLLLWKHWDFSLGKLTLEERSQGTYAKTISLKELTRKRRVENVWEIYNDTEGKYGRSYLQLLPFEVMLEVSDFALGGDTLAIANELEHGPKNPV